MTLADIIIPLCGSISNERAQKIREACDMQERRVEALEKRVEALSLDVAILVEGTVEAVHEAGLRTLAQRVEALEQIRISHEADYSKSASVLADRIEALDRALSAAAEDNGDLDVRVPALERASAKNTGEGHGVAGSTPAGPSRSTTMPSTASPAGNVPSWVPSADEIQQFIDDGREGDLRSLIASRAPRPAPQPVKVNMREHANGVEVVEVMPDASERLVVVVPRDYFNPAPQPSVECLQCGHPARAHYAVQRDGFCCAMNECACELLFADVLAGANRRSALPAPDAPKPADAGKGEKRG